MPAQQDENQVARYPRQEVAEGQKHGYIGTDVEVYDPKTGKKVGTGQKPSIATAGDEKGVVEGEIGEVESDDTPDETAVARPAGTIQRGQR